MVIEKITQRLFSGNETKHLEVSARCKPDFGAWDGDGPAVQLNEVSYADYGRRLMVYGRDEGMLMVSVSLREGGYT